MGQGVTIHVDLAGITGARAVLDKVAGALGDPMQLTRRFAGLLFQAKDRAFRQQADPVTGMEWAPLSPGYVARLLGLQARAKRRAKKKPVASAASLPILQRHPASGLLASIQMYYSRTEGGIGTNLVYARIHQLGGGGKRDKRGRVMSMPARPYLGADERMRGKLLAAAQEWLRR